MVYSFIIKIRLSHFYCFPSTTTTTTAATTFISIVFPPPPPPPPPPHFYCFPSTTTTATTFLLFSLHHHRHISIVLPPPPLYIFRLANHLADVHQLDHIQRRQYLQEAKLQPKVKVVVYESEADNSGKNHSVSTRSPVQTQETVYELSRSRKNGVFFKEKAKRTTTKNKTNRKKQKKSNSWLRGYRKIV